MASPQLENGHTRIANELLEALARAQLSAREFRCLLAIARETYGWSVKAKPISAGHVARMTGLQRTKAARALERLKEMNVLSNGASGLGLQKDYEAWAKPPRSNSDPGPIRTPRSSSDRETRSSSDRGRGSKPDPLQRKGKKERKRRPRAAVDPVIGQAHQAVMAEYHRLTTERYGAPSPITPHDGVAVRRLLNPTEPVGAPPRPVGEIIEYLGWFIRNGTAFARERHNHTLWMFEQEYPKLQDLKRKGQLA